MTLVHCPECGFQNREAAKYCEKCGAVMIPEDGGEATMSFAVGETVEDVTAALPEVGSGGRAMIVRSGAGHVGETYAIENDRLSIGRSPDCDIFLDDVTVSRRHALLLGRRGECWIEDQGSLNGTYVNRRRVDAVRLEDGDEVQIGKYKLTFLDR